MTARGAGDLLTPHDLDPRRRLLPALSPPDGGFRRAMHSGGSVVDRLKVDRASNPNALEPASCGRTRRLRHGSRSPRPPQPPAARPTSAWWHRRRPTPAPASRRPGSPGAHRSGCNARAPSAPAARPRHQDSTILGVPTAPQSSPTLAPLAKTPSPPQAGTKPSTAPAGDSQGGH